MATNIQVSNSGPQRLVEEKRNSNLQKTVAQYNGKRKNESTSNSAEVPDQMLKNNQDVDVEQLKNYGSVKQGNIVRENNVEQQKRNGTSKPSYLNKVEYAKQRVQTKRNKSFELEGNREKEDGSWSDKHIDSSPVAKSRETKNGKNFVYTACNRETCRKKVAENALNTEKLTEIINNSIKEAMQSIVKESPNILKVKQDSRLSSNKGKGAENKTGEPGRPNINFVKGDRPISTLNGFHKINYSPVNRNNVYENQRMSRDMNFINNKSHATTPNQFHDKCNKITCPYLTEKMEAQPNKVKKSMKSFRMPLKHSTADNRKMTGNVNIYICSEANNEKGKQESRESDSVTATETDIKASVSTISSNKLITSLLERRRKLQKSSLQCLCRKSATVLESRIEEVPQEENHPNDATNLYVPPSLGPASDNVTAINNMNYVNDMKNLEKINRNHFDNNAGDLCNVQNCPYLTRRSKGHGDYIKNSYPMNISWSTKNDAIIPNNTIECDCFCTKKNCPYLFGNGSLASVDQYDVSNNKGKDRFDRKWRDSEIEEVCIYCAPGRDKKLEQCRTRKLNNIWKKCIKARKQKEPVFKNYGTSQRRNCAGQCSISNSIKEEIEENNSNMSDADLPEKVDSQRQEVDVSSSYNKGEKASVEKLKKDEATALPAKLILHKSSVLLSSINYEEKYQDEPPSKIGPVASSSEEKNQSQQKYIPNAELVSPIAPSPIILDKQLDTVTTQKVTPALKNNKKPVIVKKDQLKLPVPLTPFSKVQGITETKEKENQLDDKIEKDLISKENQKDPICERIVKRVKELLGFSNVTDNTNGKKRKGCGPSCRALPRNLVDNGDAENQSSSQPAVPSSTDKSKKKGTKTTDKVKDYEYKVESHKDVLNINKEHASKAKLRNLIAKKKMSQSNTNKNTAKNEEIKINKDILEIEEDAQAVTSVTNAKESKSSKNIIGSITDNTEGSRTTKQYDSQKSKNLENLRSPKLSDKISAQDSQVITDTTNAVINGKEIESQQNLTNSPRKTISKDSKNLDTLDVSSNLKITEESLNFQETDDPENFAVSKTENYSARNVKSNENSEADSIEEDSSYPPYTKSFDGYIQSKKTQQIGHVCNCKESEKDFRVCIICCSPEDNCSCKSRNKIKTMICVKPTNNNYRDNVHDGCTCQKSVCNCSRYDITQNNCNCNREKITDTITCNCNKKNIVSVQDDDMICVTAWKSANDNNKYFTRTLEDFEDVPKECRCFDNSKPYGSEELPYQRLGAFSQVMTELQEKMNESVGCKKCQNTPCCCVIKEIQTISNEAAGDKAKIYSSFDRSRSQSRSPSSCKCAVNTCDSLSWKTSPSEVKDRHKPTSCCCRQSRSAQCRSRAKCFYCKCSPCRCLRSRETSRSRSCKYDNSLYRNGEVSLSKVKDTHSQIFKNFKCLCTTPRNPCSC